MDKAKEQELKLEIQIDDDIASGRYTNMVVINHNDSEFVFDYIYVQPQAPKAKVQSRVITSPRHAKRLLRTLQRNIQAYEQRFGEIELEEKTSLKADVDSPMH
ncbi:Protein of unknown function [Malonomonas rubra DSM 5091]|uniref:DUF3467 domain-containing protein n=1 Tax=Malonomonas rubra DSM 5091 TaxID=1122189 RepID=A0A1M6BEC7_MALRU|nr:DUF3467 domain-containing protein [Malonomonas rubra]SHI47069.1 Protein of unknown function [Malonomonas rubra DSM 5091]